MMRIRVLIVGAVIVTLAGGLMAVRARGSAPNPASQRAQPAPAQPAPTQPAPVSVTVGIAQRADFVTTVSATGAVASLRQAKIASRLSGIVAEVFVAEGQRVQAGTPLMRLRTSDLAANAAQNRAIIESARARLTQLQNGARPEERRQAAAGVAQAEAAVQSAQANEVQAASTLALAQANVQRVRALQEMGAISRQDLDSAESQFQQRQAGVMAAQSQLRQAQAALESVKQSQRLVDQGPRSEEIAAARAQVAQAEAALAYTQVQIRDATVTAPFAGTIARRTVEPGEAVSPAATSFILAQLDEVYAELAVPEMQRPGLQVGQTATIIVDALPGSQFKGKIAEIQPGAATSTRSFTVKVRVSNPQDVLRPGMFARGTVTVAVRPNVLQVPDRAVLTTAGKPIVFVVRDGKAMRREVTLGEQQDGQVEITGGLNGGEHVVVSGVAGLTDNQLVTPRAAQ